MGINRCDMKTGMFVQLGSQIGLWLGGVYSGASEGQRE